MKVLVTGARGLLGSALCPYLEQRGYDVQRHSRTNDADVLADLADFSAARSALDQTQPDLIMNLAACTNVDECELNPKAAYAANTHIVENLARWIRENENRCHLVQLSTDQVYDGTGPHGENATCPANYYAFSKYAGELAAISVRATVLRTNFVGRSLCPVRQTLSDWFIESFNEGTPITLVDDVYFSPLDIAVLPPLIERVCQAYRPGIFNMGSRGGMSKADLGECLAEKLGLSRINAFRRSVTELNLRAYRPRDMRLDSALFEKTFQIALPTIEQTVTTIADSYRG